METRVISYYVTAGDESCFAMVRNRLDNEIINLLALGIIEDYVIYEREPTRDEVDWTIEEYRYGLLG